MCPPARDTFNAPTGLPRFAQKRALNRPQKIWLLGRIGVGGVGGADLTVGDYFRFLKSFSPSISVMYSNPDSMRFCASSMFLATLQLYSSVVVKKIADSKFM